MWALLNDSGGAGQQWSRTPARAIARSSDDGDLAIEFMSYCDRIRSVFVGPFL